jgi:hypothetical protein
MIVVIAALASAAPTEILHQGRLLDPGGSPYNGTVSATFAVYDVATNGTALHTEVESLSIQDGYYTVALGPFPPTVLSATSAWVEVTVGTTTLAPRTPILASFHALNPGPQGPAGPAGPEGPQGPAGPSGGGFPTGVGYYASATTAHTAGLTHHWLFDDTLTETLGVGDATLVPFGPALTNGPTFVSGAGSSTASPFTGLTQAERPSVLDFDGTSDYVEARGRKLNQRVYTVLMWLYMDAPNPATRTYLYDGRGGGGSWYYLVDGAANVKWHNCNSEWDPTDVTSLVGRWSFHALRSDGTTRRITIDGTSAYNVSTTSGTCEADDRDMVLGTYYGARGGTGGEYWFNGRMAEVAVFDGTYLSDAEINAIFTAKKPLLYTP